MASKKAKNSAKGELISGKANKPITRGDLNLGSELDLLKYILDENPTLKSRIQFVLDEKIPEARREALSAGSDNAESNQKKGNTK